MDVAVQQEVPAQPHSIVRPTPPKKRPFDEVHATSPGPKAESLISSPSTICQHASSASELQCQRESLVSANSENQTIAQPPPDSLATSVSIPLKATTLSDHSSNTASIPITASSTNSQPNPSTPTQPIAVPNKKRKLSPVSKGAKEQEKAKKEEARKIWEEEKRKREEMKRKKEEEREEERRRREEEKRKKDEEKEAERRKREEKKKQKEEERLAREEEKKKKERSQMRLNAFFVKPPMPNTLNSVSRSEAILNKIASEDQVAVSESNSAKVTSDYDHEFPPFFIQSHVRLGTSHRFERDPEALAHVREKIDTCLKTGEEQKGFCPGIVFKPSELFNIIPYKRRSGKVNIPTVKEILAVMRDSHSSQGTVIDLTGEDELAKKASQAQNMLRKIPMKVLQFREDVRPPYQGTFTKRLPGQSASRLCRNPFSRAVPDLNYDYDSEAEWEEPEEGEDLESEGEDEVSEDDEEDMDDFLDDGDDEIGKRKMVVGDLAPVCTGICWADGSNSSDILKSYQMEILSETFSLPIDPFSDAYWQRQVSVPETDTTQPAMSTSVHGKSHDSSKQTRIQSSNTFLAPPSNAQVTPATSATSSHPSGPGAGQKPRAQFPSDQLAEFRQSISGSDLTKAGLIEVLKKRFPKVSKEVIKDTLTATAVRQGQKEADKRWVLI
ncbi:chromatin assembly factor-I (CAF-I) p90 subunit [Emydomyces testavorans]|uniref:Chromatin assembly factor-I (CAF-I) p90 subunit n=1 Tax=Emydomyces testavorans TaxID=2070801 RepID=A0AAF0DCU9_9EURO|nr:chromatin assembly factor-I (CAF-I) p90 subunit [Emydomyces testavorans]